MAHAEASSSLAVDHLPVGRDEDVVEFAQAADRFTHWLRRATPNPSWGAVGFTTLDRVAQNGPHRITDLAEAEHVSQPGMTGLVGRLASAGLVDRRRDPGDGRAVLVSITGPGQEYLDSIHEGRARLLAERVARLAEADRVVLFAATSVLRALVVNVDAEDHDDR